MAGGQALSVARIGAARAALALRGMEGMDPRGLCDGGALQAMCDAGECFEAQAGAAKAVYVLTVANGVCWVDALVGSGGGDLVEAVDSVITGQAKGLRAIGLQTMRPGLVRRLERLGYRVTGWVMRKDLQ